MPRTRDLFLFGTIVCFLLVGIGGTFLSNIQTSAGAVSEAVFAVVPTETFSASIITADTPSRETRLEQMRSKIAAAMDNMVPTSEPETPAAFEEGSDSESAEVESEATLACGAPLPYRGAWDPMGLQFMTSEGVQVIYRETMPATASSAPQTDTLLQLPIRSFPDAEPTCVTQDVIGVAKDGSLIRNNEVGLYGVFGAETQVGYALDGFPIYGKSSRQTDQCGGAMVNGQYAYYLSSERNVILGCFASPPALLP